MRERIGSLVAHRYRLHAAIGHLTEAINALSLAIVEGPIDPKRPVIPCAWILYTGDLMQGTMPIDSLATHDCDPELSYGPSCIEHRLALRFAKLRGITTDHPCDPACTHAEGDPNECRCRCGGMNHGTE